MLGERGGGHKLGQVRLGPARLAHCMRWLGQIEMALEMLIDRAQKRFAHGSYLSQKQSIQWMMADSAKQVHGALGYSTDTPLAEMMQQARWARLADGADEVHQMRIAELLMRAYNQDGSINRGVGGWPL